MIFLTLLLATTGIGLYVRTLRRQVAQLQHDSRQDQRTLSSCQNRLHALERALLS